jgi:ATP-binding cassette, subfamily G (WHITE), member 2, SNQ2
MASPPALADIREGSSYSPNPSNTGVQETTTPNAPLEMSSPHPNRPRMNSCVSHVSIGFFDPEGVGRLQHTLTDLSISDDQAQGPAPGEELTKEMDKLKGGNGEAFDFEKALRELVKRRAEVDIKSRELGVHFEDLRVVGVGATAMSQPTMGSVLNPMNVVNAIKTMNHTPLRDILTGFEGVVHPGEMLRESALRLSHVFFCPHHRHTVVLGSPGSGCTTLLKALTNQRSEYHSVHGTVSYDSLTPSSISSQFRGDIQYCPEDDVHFPTLTVQETIEFAASTRAPQTRIDGKSRAQFVRTITSVFTTIFGLRHVLRTKVGDQAIRGVSGGEKKRVSISESLATRSLINAWDK